MRQWKNANPVRNFSIVTFKIKALKPKMNYLLKTYVQLYHLTLKDSIHEINKVQKLHEVIKLTALMAVQALNTGDVNELVH